MNSNFENGSLTINLIDRIDSANASEVEKEIFDLIDKNAPSKVILDAADCEYISSAGLRVVLKLKKTVPDSKVINASTSVYEVFDMTGFSDIIGVEKAMREISVEGCEKIGEGGFGIVYRINSDTIVKIYKKAGIEDIKKEINLAKQAFIKGIPTAISYDIVKCGDKYGVVFELIKSNTLSSRIISEPERFDEYVEKYVKLMRTVHSTVFSDVTSAQVNDVYKRCFEAEKDFITENDWDTLMGIIDMIPKKDTIVHGDMHARNIMMQGDEMLLIDMDEIKCGHPVYDLANIFFGYKFLKGIGKTEKYLGMNNEMCKKFIDKFTDLYFADLSPADTETVVKGIDAFAMLRYAYTIILASGAGSERVANVLKDSVFPNVDAMSNAIRILEENQNIMITEEN